MPNKTYSSYFNIKCTLQKLVESMQFEKQVVLWNFFVNSGNTTNQKTSKNWYCILNWSG